MDYINLASNDSNILYISQFGSYGSIDWVENVSDIDIGVILNSMEDLDFSLEDNLISIFREVYNYSNVNITVVEMNLDDKLTRNIICGKTLYSTIDEKTLKRQCLYIEKSVSKQRSYYEYIKLQKVKNEVSELW